MAPIARMAKRVIAGGIRITLNCTYGVMKFVWTNLTAYSDEVGQTFRYEVGHVSDAKPAMFSDAKPARDSDLMSAT
ncbi:putative transposase [Novosphingobium sp. PY1]|nr:putative transposase [Novosphingobium sp. PY1]